MSPLADVRSACAPPLAGAESLLRWIRTNNPFYVLSAGLFLIGLRLSFGAQALEEVWALMLGMAGYTLLLALTGCLLVRFGNVWDDVRTVLLLVVLMFLATSVTFDEVLVMNPSQGHACYLLGLLFAVAVSEGLLRGIRLELPALFRVPYYLILTLFFLYPLALSRLVGEPRSEALMWSLFGFSSTAGLVFLTLLPAIRRGADYVRANGSPWRWPLYPWVLFGLLACAVPARAFLLCWSLHLPGFTDYQGLIFGPYFLVPFGFAVAVLLLEIGLASSHRGVLRVALLLPLGLAVLATIGHRPEAIYHEFLGMFTARLGGTPLYLTLLASIGFYAYAALRQVPWASEALTAALASLAVVGPETLNLGERMTAQPVPLLAAAVLQLALWLWHRAAWRCLLGCGCLTTGAALVFGGEVAFHLGLLAVLILGAAYDDALGRLLRVVGAALVLTAGLAVLLEQYDPVESLPSWLTAAYPLAMAALLAGYGLRLGHRPSLAAAALLLTGWLIASGCWSYRSLRQMIVGLEYLLLSLAVFALAVLISLGKSGVLARWLTARRKPMPDETS